LGVGLAMIKLSGKKNKSKIALDNESIHADQNAGRFLAKPGCG